MRSVTNGALVAVEGALTRRVANDEDNLKATNATRDGSHVVWAR